MGTSVVLLGTGTPRTELGRAGAATAIVVDGATYLFDFGPGVGRRISRAHQSGIVGMALRSITRAFLTHHHSDHTSGLPDLHLTSWMLHRDSALKVYGPQGTRAMCTHIVAAYTLDVAKRTLNEPHTEHGHKLEGHDIVPGLVYEDDRVKIEAFDVPHGVWATVHGPHPTLGYRITTADRSIVISGDTTYHEEMTNRYRAADVVVHEVYSSRGLAARPPPWQEYHRHAHTAAADLGRVASAAEPEMVVLTHQLLWDAQPQDIMDEITQTYDGPVTYGTDLLVI